MTPALPYPDQVTLHSVAQEGALLPCHQCANHPQRRSDCYACLGSGFIRPCARCFLALCSIRQASTPCLICGGLMYTAGQHPEREDSFYRRPWMNARNHGAI
jgi:hypothetical protein